MAQCISFESEGLADNMFADIDKQISENAAASDKETAKEEL